MTRSCSPTPRALLTSAKGGATDYVQADLRNPESILAAAARTLDFEAARRDHSPRRPCT